MLSAIEQIKSDYDYEDAKQIVTSGCQSGVCFKHIYYADTVEFFNKYPDEITRYVVDELSIEFLKDTLEQHDGDLDGYLNELTWAFIELVCDQIVNEYESTTCEELNDDDYITVKLPEGTNLTKVTRSELLQDVMFGSHLSKATSMAMDAIL